MRLVALDGDKIKPQQSLKAEDYQNIFLENISTVAPNQLVNQSFKLQPMKNGIIKSKDLKCQPSPRKQTHPLNSLERGKVNERTAKCTSYLKSLYYVIYPKGTNTRKK